MPRRNDPLARYHARLAELKLSPLWERIGDLLPAEPRVESLPYRWDYDALRPMLLESADLIAEDQAERRVLILENPGLAGQSAITESLFAGLQLIMPGEIAPSHRHTPAALRFILEAEDAYTCVDGEPLPMCRGDFILTPGWSWHDHHHDGTEPVIWLDVLDLPVVRTLGPRFAERHPDRRPAVEIPEGRSEHLYGRNLRPIGYDASWKSPLRYPYGDCRRALEHLKDHTAIDECLGLKMEYVNPLDGSAALPTISAFLQLLPRGFAGTEYQSTDGGIYCIVEGLGSLSIGSGSQTRHFDYKPNDIFAIPCWAPHAFTATQETIIFSATDRVIQTKLGLWRERREARMP
jgi:gentisate 1,2-dioxygenase